MFRLVCLPSGNAKSKRIVNVLMCKLTIFHICSGILVPCKPFQISLHSLVVHKHVGVLL